MLRHESLKAHLAGGAEQVGTDLIALKRIVLNVLGLKERATSGRISNCLRLTIDLAWFREPLGLLQGLGIANLFRSEAAAWLIVPIKER